MILLACEFEQLKAEEGSDTSRNKLYVNTCSE